MLQARRARVDFLELAAVSMPGLEIKSIHLAGSTVHPQQDALAAALTLVSGKGPGERRQPAASATAQRRQPRGAKKLPPMRSRLKGIHHFAFIIHHLAFNDSEQIRR